MAFRAADRRPAGGGGRGLYSGGNDDNPPPDGFATWEDYFNSLISGGSETEVPVPPLEQMHLAGENENFAFYYHEEGADAYILDQAGGQAVEHRGPSRYDGHHRHDPGSENRPAGGGRGG